MLEKYNNVAFDSVNLKSSIKARQLVEDNENCLVYMNDDRTNNFGLYHYPIFKNSTWIVNFTDLQFATFFFTENREEKHAFISTLNENQIVENLLNHNRIMLTSDNPIDININDKSVIDKEKSDSMPVSINKWYVSNLDTFCNRLYGKLKYVNYKTKLVKIRKSYVDIIKQKHIFNKVYVLLDGELYQYKTFLFNRFSKPEKQYSQNNRFINNRLVSNILMKLSYYTIAFRLTKKVNAKIGYILSDSDYIKENRTVEILEI